MAEWHSNPNHPQTRTFDIDSSAALPGPYDGDAATDPSAGTPLRAASPSNASHLATDLTPRQLSELVISNPVSKIPPFDLHPWEVRSSAKSVSVAVTAARTLYATRGAVEGQLWVQCTKESPYCKIGKIYVYLVGIEETLPCMPKSPNRRLFFSKRLTIQDVTRAPTTAVVMGNPDEHGMWRAKQGIHVFNFSIPIHSDAYRDVKVVESVPFSLLSSFSGMIPPTSPLIKETSQQVKRNMFNIGKKGTVKLTASVRVPNVNTDCEHGVWLSGGVGVVSIGIVNESARWIREVSVTLTRRIKTFVQERQADHSTIPSPVSDIACSLRPLSFVSDAVARRTMYSAKTPFRSGRNVLSTKFFGGGMAEDDYLFGQDKRGEKGYELWSGVAPETSTSLALDINIPMSARSIRYGFLIDVSFVVDVVVKPTGCSPIMLSISVTILHPASVWKNLPSLNVNIADVDQTVVQHSGAIERIASRTPESESKPELAAEATPQMQKEETFVASSPRDSLLGSVAIAATEGIPEPSPASVYAKKDYAIDRLPSRHEQYKPKAQTLGRASMHGKQSVSGKPPVPTPRTSAMTLSRLSPLAMNSSDWSGLGVKPVPAPSALPPSLSVINKLPAGSIRAGQMSSSSVASSAAPPPPPPPPPGNMTMRIPTSTDLSAEGSLDGVPRMDLVQEIDKLFACVPVE
nr:hypothetical protein HK105_001122 [Polyrhizophydium stewartii]